MTTTPEQIEAVARAAYERWRITRPNAPLFESLCADAMESELASAIDAISAMRPFIRAEALEEAADVAECAPYRRGGIVCGCSEGLGNWTAAAIRALKDNNDPQTS